MNRFPLSRLTKRFWGVSIGIVGLMVIAVIVWPAIFLAGYMVAYLATLSLILGSIAIILIASLAGAFWVDPILTPLRSSAATLPFFLLLSIPLVWHIPIIFAWVHTEPNVSHAATVWLQPQWLAVRIIMILIIWLLIIWSMGVWQNRKLALPKGRVATSLILLIICNSIFGIDWVMALIAKYTTSIIGMLLVSEQIVASLALCTLWYCFKGESEKKECRDLGNLLLAAIMFFSYCLFMDFLIVWEANLPLEIAGYLKRDSRFIQIACIIFIALPILSLIFKPIKTQVVCLRLVALLLLVGHIFVVTWLLSPAFKYNAPPVMPNLIIFFAMMLAWLMIFIGLSKHFDMVWEEHFS